MKRQLLAALTAGIIISAAGTALAAEDPAQGIQFDGRLSIHYRDQYDKNRGVGLTNAALKTTFTLNVNAPLAQNLEAYTSFSYQTINTNASPGWSSDYFDTPANDNAAISAFGLKYKNDGYSYVIGSQSMTLGGGLVYGNYGIGRHDLPYALNVSKKLGATDLNLIAAKTNYENGIDNDKFYVVQGSYAISPDNNIGAMFAHVSYGKDSVSRYSLKDTNFYSVYGSHNLSDVINISEEYLKSSAPKDNQAIQINLSYKADKKNTLAAGYYYAEDQTAIADYHGYGMTTAPNNNTKGYIVSGNHKFDKNLSLSVGYLAYKKINDTSTAGGASTDRHRVFATAALTF
ncbi:hypothetical protein Ga0466249_001614 [Sporomusaceae bacterium BoRhaA]|uniref:hypothetical protein n=1 Tax=Pelorhabdus rhamnosifermentans TaxID=2772457 RepID=UPI001C0602AC|nr:hypothetical protein [Pelorhabdus rhamnosifermentans]MBU2700522.1 hypothetical protein [Pelorhabdus rhamnosifermentans]